jgi:hypothetical protein
MIRLYFHYGLWLDIFTATNADAAYGTVELNGRRLKVCTLRQNLKNTLHFTYQNKHTSPILMMYTVYCSLNHMEEHLKLCSGFFFSRKLDIPLQAEAFKT